MDVTDILLKKKKETKEYEKQVMLDSEIKNISIEKERKKIRCRLY